MKKKFSFLIFTFVAFCALSSVAVPIGDYDRELKDGIFDRIQFNLFQKDKKFIEITEPPNEKEKQKEIQEAKDTEYDRYKYLFRQPSYF